MDPTDLWEDRAVSSLLPRLCMDGQGEAVQCEPRALVLFVRRLSGPLSCSGESCQASMSQKGDQDAAALRWQRPSDAFRVLRMCLPKWRMLPAGSEKCEVFIWQGPDAQCLSFPSSLHPPFSSFLPVLVWLSLNTQCLSFPCSFPFFFLFKKIDKGQFSEGLDTCTLLFNF